MRIAARRERPDCSRDTHDRSSEDRSGPVRGRLAREPRAARAGRLSLPACSRRIRLRRGTAERQRRFAGTACRGVGEAGTGGSGADERRRRGVDPSGQASGGVRDDTFDSLSSLPDARRRERPAIVRGNVLRGLWSALSFCRTALGREHAAPRGAVRTGGQAGRRFVRHRLAGP